MRKYLKYKCPICKREKDELVDTKRVKVFKCSITLGCVGRLFPIKYSETADLIPNAPPVGVENWYSRLQDKPTWFKEISDNLIVLTNGPNSSLFVMVSHDQLDSPSDVVKLTFSMEQASNNDFREYVFNTTLSTEVVSGIEDGISKKVLRYNTNALNPDVLVVYVNGVKLTEGLGDSQYQVNRSSNTIIANTIKFNTPLLGRNRITIIVTKASINKQEVIEFERLMPADKLGAWDSTNYITSNSKKYYIFHHNFENSTLDRNRKMFISKVVITQNGSDVTLPTASCKILLTNGELTTRLDRVLTNYVSCDKISNTESSVFLVNEKNTSKMVVSELLVDSIFPAFTVTEYSVKQLTLTTNIRDSEALSISNKFIRGPH